MAATEIIPFTQADLPAHLGAVFTETNIAPRVTIDQLSYRGKTWRRIVDGEETKLTKKNEDGDIVPVNIVNLVILDHNKQRSRAYYEGDFVEGKNATPTCASSDGITPDKSIKEPCAATCATCPNSVKGSKVTPDGKQTTLCSPFKRIVVVPSGVKQITDHPPLLLRLAQTSVWDKDNKENESKGWYAFDQFMDLLRARGAPHTGAVETRVKFDMDKAYPKLLFSASRWLNPDEATAVKAKLKKDMDTIEKIKSGAGENDGVAGQPAPAEREPDATSTATTPKAAPAGPSAEEVAAQEAAKQAAVAEAAKKAAKLKKQQEAQAALAAAQAAAAAAAAEDDDDNGFGALTAAVVAKAAPVEHVDAEEVVKAAPAPKAAAPVADVMEGTPDGLKDLLNGWDDN